MHPVNSPRRPEFARTRKNAQKESALCEFVEAIEVGGIGVRVASRKLDRLDAATSLGDLARPGNRLEALKGRRRGHWSIRINDQWRICFKWPEGNPGPTDVEIVDYH